MTEFNLEKELAKSGYNELISNGLILESSRPINKEIPFSLDVLNNYSRDCSFFDFSAELNTKIRQGRMKYGIGKNPPEREFYLIIENEIGGSDLIFVDQTAKGIYEQAVLDN